ncbi:MAG TPA: glycosyltransferase family 4 protein [Pyrinomonadaceae bacterium]|jgi:glycosyltransferase involved in cell wall biosynthesis|nr:glycosyltransferase family 4 protein [Pyrinomonadaceae bacterium]
MNVLICTAQVPFTSGGGELHVANLKQAFIEAGHVAEIAAVPFKWYPPREIMRGALAWRMLDLTEANGKPVDMVVGMKFPAYLVDHPCKVVWVMHQFRAAYDLWGTRFDDLCDHPEGPELRTFIKGADERFLPESRKVFANSKTVADRLRRYNNIESEPLYHPPPTVEWLCPGGQHDYVFFPSRLEPIKRQELLIEAASLLKSPMRVILAGDSHDHARYESLIRQFGVKDRVQILRPVAREVLVDLYSNALAICYLPFEEDYGYVTLEAMHSGKPVVVLTDGGGAREFIDHGSDGLIVEPEPAAIADAIDELYADKQRARIMGERGREKILAMDLSWQTVVERLVSAAR